MGVRKPAIACVPTVEEDAQGRRRITVGERTFLVYQVYYDDASARRLDPLYTPYRNDRLDRFFESTIIAELLAARHQRAADFFGVFSWKFAAKIPLDSRAILARIQADRLDSDVYSFFGRIRARRLWPLAEHKHPGILRAATLLLRRLDVDVDPTRLEAPIVYQNHFLCRSPLYERFGDELLAPALRAMTDDGDTELQSLLEQDSTYRDPRLPEPQTRAIFGQPHIGLQPFIAERLFSTWLALNPDVRVRHVWRGRFVEAENVGYEPEMDRASES
jgi:hypothetical protein